MKVAYFIFALLAVTATQFTCCSAYSPSSEDSSYYSSTSPGSPVYTEESIYKSCPSGILYDCPYGGYYFDYILCTCLPFSKPSKSCGALTCGPLEYLEYSACKCDCLPRSCAGWFENWNQKTCSCDRYCDYEGSCSPQYRWDWDKCTCVYDPYWQSSTGPYTSDTHTDSSTWESTSESSTSSSSCSIPDCRWCDFLDYESCICYRSAIKCAPGYITSADGCSCELDNSTCLPVDCIEGYLFDELTCSCIPAHDPSCPENFVYDIKKCKCVCEIALKCPDNFVFDELQCKCACPKSEICEADFVWNDRTCGCICNVKKICKKNWIFDPHVCDCICDSSVEDTECPSGFIFDRNVCGCVQGIRPSCPPRFIYNEVECGCVCEKIIECPDGQVFNIELCQCMICIEEVDDPIFVDKSIL